jgi:hypothetical protein
VTARFEQKSVLGASETKLEFHILSFLALAACTKAATSAWLEVTRRSRPQSRCLDCSQLTVSHYEPVTDRSSSLQPAMGQSYRKRTGTDPAEKSGAERGTQHRLKSVNKFFSFSFPLKTPSKVFAHKSSKSSCANTFAREQKLCGSHRTSLF